MKYRLLLSLTIGFTSFIDAQEIEFFTLKDFDLKGKVAECEVRTRYGKEIYQFDTIGRLVKHTTSFDKNNYDLNTYSFNNDALTEKRTERVKEGNLSKSESIAHLYRQISPSVIEEIIISYDKKLAEKKTHWKDSLGRVEKIEYQHDKAVDTYYIDYEQSAKASIKNQRFNEDLIQTEEFMTRKDGIKQVKTITYLEGQPDESVLKIYNLKGMLWKTSIEKFDNITNEWMPLESMEHFYDNKGVLKSITLYKGNVKSEVNYIFMMDNHQPANWVKKIETPKNNYTTRVITYRE